MKKLLVSLFVLMFVAVLAVPVQSASIVSDNIVVVDDEKPKKDEKKAEKKEATKESKSEGCSKAEKKGCSSSCSKSKS